MTDFLEKRFIPQSEKQLGDSNPYLSLLLVLKRLEEVIVTLTEQVDEGNRILDNKIAIQQGKMVDGKIIGSSVVSNDTENK